MILVGVSVADDDELNVFQRDAGCLQRHVFGNCVILAIAAAGSECFERRAPTVDDTPLYEIARRDYRQVDCTIDHANARATAARAALIDDGKKNLCSRRTRRCVFAAARQDFFIFPNFRLDIYPFVQDFSLGNAFGRQSERKRLRRRLICRRRPDALGTHSNLDALSRRAPSFAPTLASPLAPWLQRSPDTAVRRRRVRPRPATRKPKRRMPRRERALSRPKGVFVKRAFSVVLVSV